MVTPHIKRIWGGVPPQGVTGDLREYELVADRRNVGVPYFGGCNEGGRT